MPGGTPRGGSGRRRPGWAPATVVAAVRETPSARTLTLDVDGWVTHRAGQHVDLRLTADDGHQAVRSYSLASAPGEPPQVTVEALPDGEVSPHLVDVAEPGDALDVLGPVGGWFVREPDPAAPRPLLLVAGGSGVVPFRAMLRHRLRSGDRTPVRLVVSAGTLESLPHREELLAVRRPGVEVLVTLTREAPAGWDGRRGRVDAGLLTELGWAPEARPQLYVCGPTAFVERVASALVDLGHDPAEIRTERFGGS